MDTSISAVEIPILWSCYGERRIARDTFYFDLNQNLEVML